MQYQSEILRFKEGARNRHPSPEATVAAAQSGVLSDAGSQIAVLVDLIPQLPYRSREIRTLVVKTYWTSSGSIVARLRRALAAANRHLVYFNQEAPSGNKCSGSITCAVFSDDEVFLGQVGAGYAFFLHPTEPQFELFPKRGRLLVPLGATTPPAIHVSYTTMTPESIACLATTGLAESQAREVWHQTLGLTQLNPMTNRLNRDLSETGMSGSIILIKPQAGEGKQPKRSKKSSGLFKKRPKRSRAKEGEAQPLKAAADRSPRTASPRALPVGAQQTTSDPTVSPQPSQRRDPDAGGMQTQPKTSESSAPGKRRSSVVDRESTVRHGPSETKPASSATPVVEVRTSPVGESSSAGEADTEDVGRTMPPTGAEKQRAKSQVELPTVNISLAPIRARIERFLEERRRLRELRREKKTERTTTMERARLRQALRTLLPGKVKGETAPAQPTPPSERASVMAGVSLGILFLVLAITLSQYLRFGGNAKAEELLGEAQTLLPQAYESQASEDWYQLLDLSRRAVQLDPESEGAQELLKEVQQNVDSLEDALVLNTTPLLDLGTTQSARRIVVAGDFVYLLNTATNAVVALPLAEDFSSTSAEGATTILKRGETYMGEVVNQLIDLAWVEPGGNYPDGAIFIYSEGGTIYIYEPTLGPGSITLQNVQGDLRTGTVSALETFGERFYLVDRQKNQILMYEPVNGIYESPRAYFGTDAAPNLHNALDIAIDGRIYLLMGDGDIQTYFAGSHDYSFKISNLPDPDFTPKVMAIENDLETGLIYLGDPKNDRIIVLDKRGDFRHQYRLPRGELKQVEAIAIREDPKVLYIIAENTLHAAPLPVVP